MMVHREHVSDYLLSDFFEEINPESDTFLNNRIGIVDSNCPPHFGARPQTGIKKE